MHTKIKKGVETTMIITKPNFIIDPFPTNLKTFIQACEFVWTEPETTISPETGNICMEWSYNQKKLTINKTGNAISYTKILSDGSGNRIESGIIPGSVAGDLVINLWKWLWC